MARKAAKRKSVKTKAKTAVKRTAKKVAKKTTKTAVRKVKAKAKRKVAKRTSAAKRTVRTVANTYDTAISTLTHYIEKGGENLSAAGKSTLEAARDVIHGVATKVSKATR